MPKLSNKQLYIMWDVLSRIAGAIPPIIVACYYFPLWIDSGSKPVMSGSLIIVVLIASIPFFREFKNIMKFLTNASMPVLWGIGACLSYVLMNVSNEIFAICIGGLVGSAISMGICTIRNKYKEEETEKSK